MAIELKSGLLGNFASHTKAVKEKLHRKAETLTFRIPDPP